jgi:hypothetical protein
LSLFCLPCGVVSKPFCFCLGDPHTFFSFFQNSTNPFWKNRNNKLQGTLITFNILKAPCRSNLYFVLFKIQSKHHFRGSPFRITTFNQEIQKRCSKQQQSKTLQKQRKNSQNKKMEEFSDARLSYKF